MSRRKPVETPEEGSENPFRRWSERKLRARQASANLPEPIPEAKPEGLDEVPTEALDEAVPTDADMPTLESLSSESDYSGFLSPGVSDELRRLALRQLFGATKFNIRDGLDDYDEDFTRFAKLGDVITSDLRHRLEMEHPRSNADTDADVDADAEEASTAAVPEESSPEAAASLNAPRSKGNGGEAGDDFHSDRPETDASEEQEPT